MSDENDTEEIEVDVNHPWVHASTVMKPQPVMSSVTFDAVEWKESADAEPKKAALLTVIDATGVKNIFIPPQMLHELMLMGGAIMQQWQQEQMKEAVGKLIPADKNIERQVIEEQKIHKAARDGRGPNPFRSV
jgi:hypothetical protein